MSRQRATLVFLDETGLMLLPLLKKTWAPRGQTPVLHFNAKHHRRVSVIGAITVSPRLRKADCHVAVYRDTSITQHEVIAFLRRLLRQIRGPLVLLWDRLNAHRGALVTEFLKRHPRLETEFFPTYSPDLNPTEGLWAHSKWHALSNYCPTDTTELEGVAQTLFETYRDQQALLRSFIKHTPLPLRI